VLTRVLRAEQAGQAAYAAALRFPSAEIRAVAKRFKAHEDRHVAALATSLDALGARRPPPLRRLAQPPPGDARGQLMLLLGIEERLLREWIGAHRGLENVSLIRMATQVLACQAQHVVVLREALGRDPLPSALDDGA
jgi:hypothetical protein